MLDIPLAGPRHEVLNPRDVEPSRISPHAGGAPGYDDKMGAAQDSPDETGSPDTPTRPAGGLFAGLSDRLGEGPSEATSLDLLDLDDVDRRVMRALMRGGSQSRTELSEAIAETVEVIEQTLAALGERGLVESFGPADNQTWKAVLGRRRSRIMPGGVWDSLGDRLT